MSTALVPNESRREFRCPVLKEQGKAKLEIGKEVVETIVEEASVKGFTITLDDRYLESARTRSSWILRYDGLTLEVRAESVSNPEQGRIRVWLEKLCDLTEVEEIKFFSWKKYFKNRAAQLSRRVIVAMSGIGILVFGLMLFLFRPQPVAKESDVYANPFAGQQESVETDQAENQPDGELG